MPNDLPKMKFERFSNKPVNYFREAIQSHEAPTEKAQFRAAAPGASHGVDAKAHVEQIERARHDGVREGLERGRLEAMEELGQAFQLLEDSAKLLQAERDEVSSRFQSQLVSLATEMARKILGAELHARPEQLLSIVKSAMDSARDANQVTLKVNPDDLTMIRAQQEALKQNLGSNVSFDLKPDPSIERGGCIIDTELGSLDARLSTQLETLRSQLDERIGAK